MLWKEGWKLRWHCFSCGQDFTNKPKREQRYSHGRILFVCPICGSKRIESIKDDKESYVCFNY